MGIDEFIHKETNKTNALANLDKFYVHIYIYDMHICMYIYIFMYTSEHSFKRTKPKDH